MRAHLLVAGVAAAALVASFPGGPSVAHADDVRAGGSPILPLSEVRPGMKGYGLTVFQGTEPERFDVEVIDILHNFRPHQDLILVKTQHPRLEVAKVVAGMSGSPIYLGGKMIGAYAYGWTYPSEAIAGVTPIEAMRADLARPTLPGLPLLPAPVAAKARASRDDEAATRWSGDPGRYDVRDHARQVAARVAIEGADARLVPAATPLLVGGFSEGAMKLARELFTPLGLEPVQAGGSGNAKPDPRAPEHFVDGGGLGILLVRGDVSAMPVGTVTRVEGPRLLGFGHPMMSAGATAMPTAIARVLWILANQQRSFKLAEAVRPLGAMVNDRQASIVVDERAVAPTLPATVEIEGATGAAHPRWSFTVAHEQFMTPSLLAMGVGSAIEATASERRDVTWTATTEVTVHGRGTFTVEDAGISIGGTPDSGEWVRTHAIRSVGALLNNPWEPVVLDRVDTKLKIRFARDLLRLRGAEPLSEVIDAGEPIRIRLHLEPWSGPAQTRVIEVAAPRELAGRDVDVDLAPGYLESPELAAPESVADLITNLPRSSFPPDTLVASVRMPEQGVAFRGNVAQRLPPGALDVLRPAHGSVVPEPFVSYARTVVPIHQLVQGKDRVRVHIRPVLR